MTKRMTAVVSGLLMLLAALAPRPAVAVPPPCAWPLRFDVDTLNAAFPDRNATYWLTRFASVPGSSLEIGGRYPAARYFSFHVYDEMQHPIDSIADLAIDPQEPGGNPFRSATAPFGSSYTVHVLFTDPPAARAPNTIYAGRTDVGTANPSGFLIYRVYVSDDPSSTEGSVGLPDVYFIAPNGARNRLPHCPPMPPPSDGIVNQAIKDGSFPSAIPRVVPWVPAQHPPRFVRFYSTEGAVLDRFPRNPVTDAVPRAKGGFLSNQHIAYLYALLSRQYGDVFVFRMRAPTAPDTRNGHHVTGHADMRYWSVCQNELATQRYVECIADFEAVVVDGWTTFVVSDPEHRPENATPEDGVNWLPWGAFYDGNVIYRHMLQSPSFDAGIQRVAEGVDPAVVMGEYFPRAAYCTTQAFESGGAGACLSP